MAHFQVLLLHLVTLTFIVSIVNCFVLKCVDVSVFIWRSTCLWELRLWCHPPSNFSVKNFQIPQSKISEMVAKIFWFEEWSGNYKIQNLYIEENVICNDQDGDVCKCGLVIGENFLLAPEICWNLHALKQNVRYSFVPPVAAINTLSQGFGCCEETPWPRLL